MVFGALFAAANGPTQDARLTIDQAVAIAQARAFAIRLQQSGLLRANSVVREANSRLGPQIVGTANLSRSGSGTGFANTGTGTGTGGAGGTGGTGGTTGSTFVGGPNTAVYGISLSVPIDLSGALRANLRSAEAQRRSQRENVAASINDTRLDARTAYLDLLRAQATVVVQEQSLVNAQAQAKQAQAQFEQVQIAKIDLDRLNAAVVQRETDLVDARNQAQLAVQRLNLTLARPIDTPVETVDVTTLPDAAVDPAALDQTARASRPETRAARELVNARAQLRAGAERANIPNLNLTLSQQRISGDYFRFDNTRNTTSLGVNFSVPLFDSGFIRSQVGIYRQDEEQAKIQLAQTELNVSQEVRAAVTNLLNARARLDNATRQVALAEEVFRIAKVRQNAGAGTYVEVVDAETTLTNARNQYVRARYDVLTAYSQLQRAVGSDGLTATPPTPEGARP